MGGIRVEAETAASTFLAFSPQVKPRQVCMARIASAEIRSPIFWFSADAPENPPRIANRSSATNLDFSQLAGAEREMLAPFERNDGEFPYAIHHDLQERWEISSASSATRRSQKALSQLDVLRPRLARVRIDGSRLFNPGWHLTRDLKNMLLISEAVTRSALRSQGKPRRSQPH